ncbi:S53 family peptidase [Granulicella paludicola]|uniref:S53 family peptidase n=1 Tax=Granulicella paludicola TaxID=474951 RepID=UPI0021DFE058|nr:S53 family peptidase [Granulicella paludicola]
MLVVLLSSAALFTAPAFAQRRVLPTQHKTPSTDPVVSNLSTSQVLNLGITLPLRNTDALKQLIKDQSDPTSPLYKHYLTPEQFATQFGPTEADYNKVMTYAKAQGFTINKTFKSRTVVQVSGPVSSVNRTFGTTIQVYKHPTEKRNYHAPSVAPTVDANLPILSVEGLSNRDQPKPFSKRGTPHAQFLTGSGPSNNFLGSDIRTAYAGDVTSQGEGQTIGLIELGPYNLSDVQSYFSTIGQTNNVPIYNVLLNVDGQCTGNCDDGEEVIDIEQIISMAPKASGLLVYEGYNDSSNWLAAFAQAADDNIAKQLSLSFGFGGTPSTQPGYEQVFIQLEAQGQSLFIASGDSGANVGDIGYPGNSPNVIDVGGTDLTTNGAGGAWSNEVTWVDSTGGWSTQSPIPAFQTPFINSQNQGSTQYRNVPDVAAEADFDSYYCANGGCYTGIGGTSLAAPRWAGFMALVNQQSNGHGVVFNSATPYQIGASNNYSAVLHDISQGNDFNTGSPDLFTAVPGYDLVTGWGSPNGQALLNLLAPPAEVNAGTNFTVTATPDAVSIKPGGSTTATVTVTPVNGFTGQVTLSAIPVGSPAGVSASIANTIVAAGSETTITIATTSTTPPGNQMVAITGTANGLTQTAYVRLAIPDFSLTVASPTLYINQSSSATDTITVDALNGFSTPVALSLSTLPPGITGALSATSTTTTSTLTLKAANAAVPTSGTPVSIVGNAGSIDRAVPALTLAVSAATGDCGVGTEVNLSGAYNVSGLTTDGTTVTGSGIDGDGYTLSSTILTTTRVLNGVRFKFGPTNAPDAVYAAGQTLALTAGKFQTLQLMGLGLNGTQTGQVITVTYTDGSTAQFTQSFSDWHTPSIALNEMEAIAMPYRNTAGGATSTGQFNVYDYSLLLDSSRTVKSVTLPNNRNVVILAATLSPFPDGTAVTLPFNATGIYTDGTTFDASGGLDGGGAAYSANLLNDGTTGEHIIVDGIRFILGDADAPNAYYGTGAKLALPQGLYSELTMVGTGVQGDQTDQTVLVTYTDGTKATFTQSFSDWSSFEGFANESLVTKMAYRDYNDGSKNTQNFNAYRYTFALNPLKKVASVTLPNNRDVVILAMTLDNNPTYYALEDLLCKSPFAGALEKSMF